MSRALLGFLLLVPLAPFGSFGFAQGEKQVAAERADILSGRLRLPRPADVPERSRIALWRVGDGAFAVDLPTSIEGPLAVALVTASGRPGDLAIASRGTAGVSLARLAALGAAVRREGSLDGGASGRRYVLFELPRVPAGRWRLSGNATGESWLVVRDAAPILAGVHLDRLAAVSDRPVALVARLERFDGGGAPLPFDGTVRRARAELDTPFGPLELELRDDGRHADGAPGDGVFGARLPYGLAGSIRARVELRAVTAAGGELVRTATHLFRVLDPDVVLSGGASTSILDERRLAIDLACDLSVPRRVHLSAEVWGRDRRGVLAPVVWLSRMVPLAGPGEVALRLSLDSRWLDRAGVAGDLELRHVRVQDPASEVPWQIVDRIPLGSPALPPLAGAPPVPIDDEMRMGARAAAGFPADRAAVKPTPGLVLSHGWCSGGNVWPPAHFTPRRAFFQDPNANRSHDEFALLLRAFGRASGMSSYGLVGHSQGGNAALHLYTYYTSGLDRSRGPRRIQSVGTPYQGTPLATLGFFACGNNPDLSTSGAATWLAGIPTWARQEVWYRTTSNAGGVCNFFTNLVLGSPNDGVVERARGVLPGGHFVRHDSGWCHTTGMSEPAQYTDASYNRTMDANAAR